MALLKRGSTGNDVKALQTLLSGANVGFEVPETGTYGAWTDRAVRAFQKSHGLKVDGIVGEKTMAALQPPLPRPKPDMTDPPQVPVSLEPPDMNVPQGPPDASLAQIYAPPAMASPVPRDPDQNITDPRDPNFGAMIRAQLFAQQSNADRAALAQGGSAMFGTGATLAPPPPIDVATANSPLAAGLAAYYPTRR